MSNGVCGAGSRPRVDGVATVGELTSLVTEVDADGGSTGGGGGISNESGAKSAFRTNGADERDASGYNS